MKSSKVASVVWSSPTKTVCCALVQNWFLQFAKRKTLEVLIINKGVDTTFEEDLAQDVLEIITVFSARLYGSRSRKNQKPLDGVKQAVEAASC